ncbi:probable methyltransferase TCM_000336 [Magnolia sinica]|uniref:probable methyltransferase TCM_000336 n=1 Tax=Magnolia sinica TaxID=86752 RepID=UPI0026584AD4|nr:probable methyltransferase TCM_000336 [Magnolia sinica]
MDVEKVFHMKGGLGETSYARNSSHQKKGLEMVKHITIETIIDLYLTSTPHTLAIADLGCSSGPNTLSVVEQIVDAVDERCCRYLLQSSPEFQVFLNDLPANDFNSIFMALPDFRAKLNKGGSREACPCVFFAGVPGSFYGRLFPNRSLHFIHSSFGLHWLSQVPPALMDESGTWLNKGKMCVSESSPPLVSKAYFMQFQQDFSLFLKSRSEELISGGRMVLILLGRSGHQREMGHTFYWEMLARAFACMVSSGEVEEESVDSYNVPFYAPSMEEIEGLVHADGSFRIDRLEMFEIGRDDSNSMQDGGSMAMAVRAIQEPMIRHHFSEGIVDGLFQQYAEMLDAEMAKREIKVPSLVVVLRKSK